MITLLTTLFLYSPFVTSVTKVNNSVPVTLFPGKDNVSYSAPIPPPNVVLPKWQSTATQYLLDAALRPTRSAEIAASSEYY